MTIEILLVEDSPADALLAREALIDTGIEHRLATADDGSDALDYLGRAGGGGMARVPDIILLDLNMPRIDGHRVLKVIRGIDAFKEIPVVVLTVSQAEEDVCRALDSGMNFYLRKPVRPDTLKILLEGIEELWKEQEESL